MPFTKTTSSAVADLKEALAAADSVLIGAGAGLSTASGLTYSGERFDHHFADFRDTYGITDMYSGGFYPFDTLEEYWAWWSRHIMVNRYDTPTGAPYTQLLDAVRNKDYFVLTTNVDHQFQLAGFEKERLFYTQGDYGLFQCSRPCHDKTYDNEKIVRLMAQAQQDMRIPTELIPRCPVCGEPMNVNLRCDATFVEDAGWHAAADRYRDFLDRTRDAKILYLELGVGANTPGIIKYPFWNMVNQNPKATYACVNLGEAFVPRQIASRSICINGDIAGVTAQLA